VTETRRCSFSSLLSFSLSRQVYVEAWFSVERNYNDFLKYALVVGVRVRVRARSTILGALEPVDRSEKARAYC